MTNDQIILIISSILVPMLAGFGWIISRMGKMENRLDERISQIDKRLSHMEGYIAGRESHLKIKGE